MASLPDDVLLVVFSLLDNKSLLRCRVVCRHWRDLALHRDAWSHRTISARYLRLSPPCCETLDLEEFKTWAEFGVLAATVACPAAHLLIAVVECDSNASLACLVIRHQINLGRLKSLSVYFLYSCETCDPDGEAREVCYDILLEQLRNSWPVYLTVKCDYPSSKISYILEEIANFVDEVEVVEPSVMAYGVDYFPPVEKLSNLRRLSCPLGEGLPRLKNCLWLQDLEIILPNRGLDGDEEDALDGSVATAKTFLRSATWLRRVSIVYGSHYHKFGARTRGLVQCLGDSGQSQLTKLEIHIEGSRQKEVWDDVLSTVPKLHHLQVLVYDGVIALEDLYKLDQARPSLCSFSVRAIKDCICCRWNEVCNLLKANPLMQLTIERVSYRQCLVGCKSNCSRESLHKLTYCRAGFAMKHVVSG